MLALEVGSAPALEEAGNHAPKIEASGGDKSAGGLQHKQAGAGVGVGVGLTLGRQQEANGDDCPGKGCEDSAHQLSWLREVGVCRGSRSARMSGFRKRKSYWDILPVMASCVKWNSARGHSLDGPVIPELSPRREVGAVAESGENHADESVSVDG